MTDPTDPQPQPVKNASGWARTALGLLRRAAQALTDEPEGRR